MFWIFVIMTMISMIMNGSIVKGDGTRMESINKNVITYKVFKGQTLEPYLPTIIKVREEIYGGFPYFFSQRDDDPSAYYTSFYHNVPEATLVGAFDRNQLIGWVIGVPLKKVDLPEYCAADHEIIPATVKFKDMGVDVDSCFYGSDIIVIPGHQNQGIELELFNRFEQTIKEYKKYTNLAWFHLDLGDDHPRKPKNFVDAEKNLFTIYGFVKIGYKVTHEWDTLQADGSIAFQQKYAMDFWVKKLEK